MKKENQNIQIFGNSEFGDLTIITDKENNQWFVAKEVCKILGIKDPSMAVSQVVKSLEKIDIEPATISNGISLFDGKQNREVLIINEQGLNMLIMQSRKPIAIKFQYWIASKVLPSIRKTGSYSVAPQLPQTHAEALRALATEIEEKEVLALENKKQADVIDVIQPKADHFDLAMSSRGLLDFSEAGKIFGIGRNRLFAFCRKQNLLIDWGNNYNEPKQPYINRGYFKLKNIPYINRYGDPDTYPKTLITQKGMYLLGKKLRKENIV